MAFASFTEIVAFRRLLLLLLEGHKAEASIRRAPVTSFIKAKFSIGEAQQQK